MTSGEKQLERKAKAVFRMKRSWGILWVAQGLALRGEARDGVTLDTRRFNYSFVNPAQEPKGGLVTGPIKFVLSVVGQVAAGPVKT